MITVVYVDASPKACSIISRIFETYGPFILFSQKDDARVRDEAYREEVFGFIARRGLDKKTILNLLRLTFWAAGGRETEYPFIRELEEADTSRPGIMQY